MSMCKFYQQYNDVSTRYETLSTKCSQLSAQDSLLKLLRIWMLSWFIVLLHLKPLIRDSNDYFLLFIWRGHASLKYTDPDNNSRNRQSISRA